MEEEEAAGEETEGEAEVGDVELFRQAGSSVLRVSEVVG